MRWAGVPRRVWDGSLRSLLPPCTCSTQSSTLPLRQLSTTASSFTKRRKASPVSTTAASSFASTSAHTIESPPPFESFFADTTTLPLKTVSPAERRRTRRTFQLDQTAPSPNPPPPLPRRREHSQISPFLPLFVRERNFLLARLHHSLYADNPDVEELWEALVGIIQYPTVVPQLPKAFRPTSERSEGDEAYEDRRGIQLSLPELRHALTVFSRVRPRTRAGFSRLLVVVELLAARAIKHPLPPAPNRPANPRDLDKQELRGGGVGLREKDWAVLIQFAALSYRAPRATHELATATSLYNQWSRANTVDGISPQLTTRISHALLDVATRARAWDLVEAIEEQLEQGQSAASDHSRWVQYRLSNRLKQADARGVDSESILERFAQGLSMAPVDFPLTVVVWNTVVWILVRRGRVEDAERVFEVMRSGVEVTPTDLLINKSPTVSGLAPVKVHPPLPTAATYVSLMQGYAHLGDLASALRTLQHMVAPALNARCKPIQPLPIHFTPLFRGFATHGLPPPHHSTSVFDPFLLSGKRVRVNAQATVTEASKLYHLGNEASTDGDSPWTFDALRTLFKAFLFLAHSRPKTLDPHQAKASGLSSRVVFWILLSFERLSGFDSRVVLEVWEALRDNFLDVDEMAESDVTKRASWSVDQRVVKMLAKHREEVQSEVEVD